MDPNDRGWFQAGRTLWPVAVEQFTKPWPEELVVLDCQYWRGEYERDNLGYPSELPSRRGRSRGITSRWCAERWGWTHWRARQAIKRHDPEGRQLGLSIGPESGSQTRAAHKPHKPHSSNSSKHNNTSSSTHNPHTRRTRASTRASLSTDSKQQTTDVPPNPPAGGADLEKWVMKALARDPALMSQQDFMEQHGLWYVYLSVKDDPPMAQEAADFLQAMKADQPKVPWTVDDVVFEMRRQGWRGSGRGGRATRADCQAIDRIMYRRE